MMKICLINNRTDPRVPLSRKKEQYGRYVDYLSSESKAEEKERVVFYWTECGYVFGGKVKRTHEGRP